MKRFLPVIFLLFCFVQIHSHRHRFFRHQMSNFNWNAIDESTFQGPLNKYTNAFKRYQTRYFILDAQGKTLLYFMPDEVRKKGPRGMVDLVDCGIVPSDEDDVTFSIQTGGPEIFKLRAMDAKERQRWIDRLRACSGSNAAGAYTASLPIPKPQQNNPSSPGSSPRDTPMRPSNRRTAKLTHRQQTLKELKEVIHCVEINQREFVETIDAIPEDTPIHALSKEMLLFRSISRSCISALEDSLIILNTGRFLENHLLSSSLPPSNAVPPRTHNTQTSVSTSNGSNDKVNPPVALSSSLGQRKSST